MPKFGIAVHPHHPAHHVALLAVLQVVLLVELAGQHHPVVVVVAQADQEADLCHIQDLLLLVQLLQKTAGIRA